MYLGSDAIALAPFTDTITYLEDGDWAVLSREQAEIFDLDGRKRRAARHQVGGKLAAGRQGQLSATSWPRRSTSSPRSSATRSRNYIDFADGRVHLPDLGIDPAEHRQRLDLRLRHRLLRRPRRQVLARALCAHSRRDRRRLRVPLPRAAAAPRAAWRCSSRSRARPPTRWRRCATARRKASASPRSSTCAPPPSRAKSDVVLPTLAGPEIGVASTKAFTCQLERAGLPGDRASAARAAPSSAAQEKELVHALAEVPRHISTLLRNEAALRDARPRARPRRGTCSTSAAASAIRSRSKAR